MRERENDHQSERPLPKAKIARKFTQFDEERIRFAAIKRERKANLRRAQG